MSGTGTGLITMNQETKKALELQNQMFMFVRNRVFNSEAVDYEAKMTEEEDWRANPEEAAEYADYVQNQEQKWGEGEK